MLIPNLPKKRMEENELRKRKDALKRIYRKTSYSFETQLEKSIRFSKLPIWTDTYKKHFADYLTDKYIKEDGVYQRQGVDRIVYLKRGKAITIDEKHDEYDNNKIFLEIWSDKGRRKDGWLVDTSKTCDYLAYLKIPNETPFTVWMIPFFELQRMWIRHKEYLLNGYDLKPVPNEDGKWCSEGIAVEIEDIEKLLYEEVFTRLPE